MITYRPLWETLADKGISQYELITLYHFSAGVLDSLRKDRSVTLRTIDRICQILHCGVADVVEVSQGQDDPEAVL